MAGYKRQVRPGTWELTVTVGADYTGKPKRFYKTIKADSEREAERELSRFFVQCEDGAVNASGVTTVEQLAELYVSESVERYLKRSTQRSTKATLKNWIVPKLGRKRLNKLKKMDVQHWINDLTDLNLSAKTIKNYYSVLCALLEYAIDMELIQHNPARGCRLPKVHKKEARSYNKEQMAQIIEGLEALPADKINYKLAVLLAIFGGFRRGEIIGFDWDDVDTSTNSITVSKTRLKDKNSGFYEDAPKTELSKRTVTLPAFMFDELRALKAYQLEDRLRCGAYYYTETPSLLKRPGGETMTPDQIDRFFRTFCKHNNIPCYGLHSLRHSHASMLVSIGADKVEVSKRLGHSNLSTTLNIYTHLFEHREQEIADQLENLHNKIAK